MTTFIGTNDGDIIAPGFISPGVLALGPDATPGDGNDIIIARGGDDLVAGGLGADTAFLGAGDDVFGWAPADGSDAVFGQAGDDRLDFDGDDNAEAFAITAVANGEGRLDRDVGAVTMRLSSMERVNLFVGGGADTVRIGDLTGGGFRAIDVDLSAAKGSGVGDGLRDRIFLADGDGSSLIGILGDGGQSLVVSGLTATATIRGIDAVDVLSLDAGGGDDVVIASGVGPGVSLTLDGGAGRDVIAGGEGDDILIGGSGNDDVTGEGGDDVVRLGAGDDVFNWEGDDGSDSVDGGAGHDEVHLVGSEASERFRLGADGKRALLTRDLDEVRLSLARVEGVVIRTGDGADHVEIADLTGARVRSVIVEMNLLTGAGDGAADTVSLTGGDAGEIIDVVTGDFGGSQIIASGLPAVVTLSGVEAADRLVVSGGGGDDIIRAREVAHGQALLTLDGGAGDDFVFGGDNGELVLGDRGDDALLTGGGDDTVIGGRGDDFARLGAGDDLFGWRPGEGNDFIDGEGGLDTLAFDGSGADEVIEILADGAAAVLLRDVGAVRMDLVEVERIDLRLFGGADSVRVGDLTGAGVAEIVIDLSGQDGVIDFITVEGGAGDDVVSIGVDGEEIVIEGLAASIRLIGFDGVFDTLVFRGLGGDDFIDATGLGGIDLIVLGGDGDDVILGGGDGDALSGDAGDDVILAGAGNDQVFGDIGDDILDGGEGFDTLNGGPGDDVLLNGERFTDIDAVTALLF